MISTDAQTFLADTIRRFQKDGGVQAIIKAANGSVAVDMDELLEVLGTAPSFSLKISGDTLVILVNGNEAAAFALM